MQFSTHSTSHIGDRFTLNLNLSSFYCLFLPKTCFHSTGTVTHLSYTTLALSINHSEQNLKKLTNKKTKQLKACQEEAGSRRSKANGKKEQPDEVLPSGN